MCFLLLVYLFFAVGHHLLHLDGPGLRKFSLCRPDLWVSTESCFVPGDSLSLRRSGVHFPMSRLLDRVSVADERAVYLREQHSSAYRPSAYFLAKAIFSLPVAAGSCLLFSVFVYPICGFQSGAEKFFRFTMTLSLCSFVGQGAGLLVGACVSSKAKAAILSPLSLAPIVLFTKYAVPKVPLWLKPLQVISPFWWAYDTLALDELGGLPLNCTPEQEFMVPWYSHGSIGELPEVLTC